MLQLLIDNPLMLLFVVAAIGYPLGRLKIGGSSLGVAAVLFVGLAVGALHPELKLPEIVYQLGLVLFVYTIGLSSGASFFAGLKRKGWSANLLVVGMLVFAAALIFIVHNLINLKATLTAGLFAGSLTNTPALAAVLEYLKGSVPKASLDQMLAEPVVGYSIAYPIGVIGMMLAIFLLQRLWKIDYAGEARTLHEAGTGTELLQNRSVTVTHPAVCDYTIEELSQKYGWDVIFGRLKNANHLSLMNAQTRLTVGDVVSIIGTDEEINKVASYLGQFSSQQLELERSQIDYRRIFVSNPKVAGRTLRELDLPGNYGAIATRIRRGDIEILPHSDTKLELGDRVRVVAEHSKIGVISRYLGDSYRALSEIDILTFSLGIALGLLLGVIPVPLPGGITIKLGAAGGPLIIALILGKLERTGPFVWTIPYSANLTVRQIGLVLFLAAVGTRAGYPFITTFTQGGGIFIFLAGTVITCSVALLTLWIGYKLLKIPMGRLIGLLAGLQTQPALLGYALEQTHNELPNAGYASVYPVAIIAKTILAQLIIAMLL